jgi:hypothetical protein
MASERHDMAHRKASPKSSGDYDMVANYDPFCTAHFCLLNDEDAILHKHQGPYGGLLAQ